MKSKTFLFGLLAAFIFCTQHTGFAKQNLFDISWLSFSPDGRYLAILDKGKGDAKHPQTTLYVVPSSHIESPPIFSVPCAPSSIAWATKPLRIVYAAREDGKLHLISQKIEGAKQIHTSLPIKARQIGSLATRNHKVSFVAEESANRYILGLWDMQRNKISYLPIPTAFKPSLYNPPVISQSGKISAIVNDDNSFFLGFKASSKTWLVPQVSENGTESKDSTMVRRAWKWRALKRQPLNEETWGGGWLSLHDKFFIDEKNQSLWIVKANSPPGATPTREGLRTIFTHDELSPLDLDNQHEKLFADKEPIGSQVWRNYVEALSSAANYRQVAIVYRGKKRYDCLLYYPSPPFDSSSNKLEQVVAKDGSILSKSISLSPDGKRLALFRMTKEGRERLEILNTKDLSVISSW